ncbi:unnamed protein product [Porites evermanni]|uniref:Homeobox domain-containing protein n=1 Tax=Porites evermanni TaxID=104178 RepID=A0ABN8MTJ2_9CNID|nr:unnamed protein product [Porites evermanni]
MDCAQLKSIVSLVDSLVRNTHVRRSRVLSSNQVPVGEPSLAPVSSKSLTDFSICSILGLEPEITQSPSSSSNPPLSPYSDCGSPRPSHRATSPPLTPYSDITSSSSDFDSEPDQAATQTEHSTRKKRQRTTFSTIEVWELERAFRRRPYLLKEDEEELVQRLGITAKSLKYWFQNRRAKSRKLERKISSVCQTGPSNQFVSRPYSVHWKQGERVSCPAMESYFRDINQRTVVSRQLSVKSNLVPKFHPDRFTIRPVEPARLPYSRALCRYQPY